LGRQDTQTNDFLDRFKGAIGNQETTTAMAGRLGNELGLPTLQKNAQSLNQNLLDLPETYGSASRGFDVNANQLQRIVGTKQAELSPFAQRATEQAQNAQNSVNTLLGYGQADQAKALMPYQTEQSFLTDRLARETTMFSQENENELNAIMDKVRNGIALSEGEKNRANALAVAEQSYQNQRKLNDQTAAQSSNSNQYLSGGQFYDTKSGKWITAPKAGGSGAKSASSFLAPAQSGLRTFIPNQ